MGANTVPLLSQQKYELVPHASTLLVVTTGGQFQYRLRSGTQTYTFDQAVTGDRYVLDGDVVSEVFLAQGDTCVAEIHAGFNEAVAGTVAVAGSIGAVFIQDTAGQLLVVEVGGTTVTDSEFAPPASLAAASAEAVVQAGANPIPIGQMVNWQGSANGSLATVADVLAYIALKGHASANYYVVILAGPSADSNHFPSVQLEKLDIVWRNADTVAHGFAFDWNSSK